MSEKQEEIPSYSDEEFRVWIFRLHSFFFLAASVVAGIWTNLAYVSIPIGIVGAYLLEKLTTGVREGAVFHWIYKKGFAEPTKDNRLFPSAFKKRFKS